MTKKQKHSHIEITYSHRRCKHKRSHLHLHFVINESMSINAVRIWCGWLNRGSSRYRVIIIAPWRASCENLRSPRDTRALWRDSFIMVSNTACFEQTLANRYSLTSFFGAFWNCTFLSEILHSISRFEPPTEKFDHRRLISYPFLIDKKKKNSATRLGRDYLHVCGKIGRLRSELHVQLVPARSTSSRLLACISPRNQSRRSWVPVFCLTIFAPERWDCVLLPTVWSLRLPQDLCRRPSCNSDYISPCVPASRQVCSPAGGTVATGNPRLGTSSPEMP